MAVRPRRPYSDEFNVNAVRLVQSMGRGRAARQLGVSEATLSNWEKTKVAEKKLSAKEQAEAERQELILLRKENAELRDVVHILKRAAAVFSKDQLK